MPSNLYPTGVRLTDTNDILLNDVCKVTTVAVAGPATIAAGAITGGSVIVMINTNAAPTTQTTRTAAQMYTDDPTAFPGQSYLLRICNSGGGTLTLAGGTGVTISGTATVATTTFRDFLVAYGGTAGQPAITITNIGLGTFT